MKAEALQNRKLPRPMERMPQPKERPPQKKLPPQTQKHTQTSCASSGGITAAIENENCRMQKSGSGH